MAPLYKLDFERFPDDHRFGKHLLFWPEFKDPADIWDDSAWEEFGKFRAFLRHWAELRGNVRDPICDTYWRWQRNTYLSQKTGPLPEGFRISSAFRQGSWASRTNFSASESGSLRSPNFASVGPMNGLEGPNFSYDNRRGGTLGDSIASRHISELRRRFPVVCV